MTSLSFEPIPDGLFVRMGGESPRSVTEWTSHADGSLATGVLMRLRDDGEAIEHDDGLSLIVTWGSVAQLTSNELRCIGLPGVAPL